MLSTKEHGLRLSSFRIIVLCSICAPLLGFLSSIAESKPEPAAGGEAVKGYQKAREEALAKARLSKEKILDAKARVDAAQKRVEEVNRKATKAGEEIEKARGRLGETRSKVEALQKRIAALRKQPRNQTPAADEGNPKKQIYDDVKGHIDGAKQAIETRGNKNGEQNHLLEKLTPALDAIDTLRTEGEEQPPVAERLKQLEEKLKEIEALLEKEKNQDQKLKDARQKVSLAVTTLADGKAQLLQSSERSPPRPGFQPLEAALKELGEIQTALGASTEALQIVVDKHKPLLEELSEANLAMQTARGDLQVAETSPEDIVKSLPTTIPGNPILPKSTPQKPRPTNIWLPVIVFGALSILCSVSALFYVAGTSRRHLQRIEAGLKERTEALHHSVGGMQGAMSGGASDVMNERFREVLDNLQRLETSVTQLGSKRYPGSQEGGQATGSKDKQLNKAEKLQQKLKLEVERFREQLAEASMGQTLAEETLAEKARELELAQADHETEIEQWNRYAGEVETQNKKHQNELSAHKENVLSLQERATALEKELSAEKTAADRQRAIVARHSEERKEIERTRSELNTALTSAQGLLEQQERELKGLREFKAANEGKIRDLEFSVRAERDKTLNYYSPAFASSPLAEFVNAIESEIAEQNVEKRLVRAYCHLYSSALRAGDIPSIKDAIRELSRHFYEYFRARDFCEDELYDAAAVWRDSLNAELKKFDLDVRIQVPQPGEPTDPRWMSFKSGNSVDRTVTWAIYEDSNLAIKATVVGG